MRFGRANVMGDVSGVAARGVGSAAKERNGGIGGGDWSDNAAKAAVVPKKRGTEVRVGGPSELPGWPD